MRARIHRGAEAVGGSCLELQSAARDRLLVDLGLPLESDSSAEVLPPVVLDDPSLLGVVLSHSHPDHYGLLEFVPNTVPLYMGAATARILAEASYFTPMGLNRSPQGTLSDREPTQIGPFEVIPFLVDHSAFDAYASLISADGGRLLYSGDIRTHGRKAATMEALIARPPHDVDVLVLEGTSLGRQNVRPSEDEGEIQVEERLASAFTEVPGAALGFYSPQNIDRLVSVFKAAIRSDRMLVLDLYGASVTAATGRDSIPQADWDRVRVYVPQSQRIKVKRSQEFWRVNELAGNRIYLDEIAEHPGRWVISCRESMLGELERGECLARASAFWMMWPGYLEREDSTLSEHLQKLGIEMEIVHASGHATVTDLQRFAAAIAAERVVPIHSDHPESYPDYFDNVEIHTDGEWWEV